MSSTVEKLEQELRVVGDRLSDPPSDVDELITLLDQLEKLLAKVEQSPRGPLNVTTSLVLKALVADKIVKNPDADVRVSVASCLSEIMRITAPDAPYNDEELKELLQLIVSTFEKLDDQSSRSYDKRLVILETTARVQSSVVMLDLECDALIIEMFQHFFRTIRDYHPESVLSSMASIITLVLNESEDISPQLLSPILACLQQDNKGALPIARKLAEDVLRKCASKVKPFLVKAVESLGVSIDDYSDVVGSMYRDKCGDVEQNQVLTNEKVTNQIDDLISTEIAPGDADMLNDKSPKSEISNDVTLAGKDKSLVDSDTTKKSDEDNGEINVPKDDDGLSNAEVNNLGTEHTELDTTLPVEEDHGKDLLGSVIENSSAELAAASENGEETNADEEQVVSPVKDAKQSADDISRTSDSETKSAALGDVGKEEKDFPTDSEERLPKRLRKRVDKYTDLGFFRQRRKKNKRRSSRGKHSPKASAGNDETKMVTSPKSTAEVGRDEHDSEATSKASSKRKRTPAKEKAASTPGKDKTNNAEEYGETLTGSRIRVWWPMDHRFYEGVVDSYDSSQKKHRVLYDDGDEEYLFMKKERWEFVEDDATADEKEADDGTNSDATPEQPEKKAKTNGEESSNKEKTNDRKSTKKGKSHSSAKSKSKTRSGKKSKDAEKRREKEKKADKPRDDEKKAEKEKSADKPKDDEKKAEKTKEDEKKVVKSQEKETPKTRDKPDTESNSKSKDRSGDIGGKIVAAASRLTGKSKSGGESEKDDHKTPKSSKSTRKSKVTKEKTADHGKRDDSSSSSSSDDDSKPLVSLLKKSPAALKLLKVKLKGKEVGEGSSGTKRKR